MKLIIVICILFSAAHIDAIINGYSAPQSPHSVNIFSLTEASVGFGGGGTLISSQHVITTGNLIFGFVEWRCRLGSVILPQTRLLVSIDAITHPNFVQNPRQNDIGIITLPANSIIAFSIDIAPIALPPSIPHTIPLQNEQGSIIGFGGTGSGSTSVERLQRGHQRVTDNARCVSFFGISSDTFFCGEDPVNFSNICNQDIGGGFVVSINGVDTLVGISALVLEACNSSWPSAYTRIQPFREWIRTVTSV